jgi:histidinol-phosphate aminotransferase
VTPYVPGEQPKLPNLVKLNTNETPTARAGACWRRCARKSATRCACTRTPVRPPARGIAARHGVTPQQVFVGNGSDEVLAHVFLGLLKHERPMLFPDITYSFYPVYCGLYGISYERLPLNGRVRDRGRRLPEAQRRHHFPESQCADRRLRAAGGDRAPAAATPIRWWSSTRPMSISAASRRCRWCAQYPQLLVTHTLSKSRALAGLRVGYAIGQADLIEALNRVKDSFNSYPLDRFAQAGALRRWRTSEYFRIACA